MPKPNPKDNAKALAISELIRQGKEQECIELLRKYGPSKVKELNEGKISIWHSAIQNNLRELVEFLAVTNHESIDCLNAQHLTPWALAVCQNKPTIARLLESKGANTGTFVDREESQTLLHKAVANSDMALLNNCVNCHVPGNIVDAKGFTASYYARQKKNKAIVNLLKTLRFADYAERIDLNNSVITNDPEALQNLINDGADLKTIKNPTLLETALIYNSNKVLEILRKAGVYRLMADEEIQEIRRKKFGKKVTPLIESYAMEKLSLKKSAFKVLPLYLTAVILLVTLVMSAVTSMTLAIGIGMISGLVYIAARGALHLRNIKHEKSLKESYKKTHDQKRAQILELAQQVASEKNANLIEGLASELKDAPEPVFINDDQGKRVITTSRLQLMDKHIKTLSNIEIEVPKRSEKQARLLLK